MQINYPVCLLIWISDRRFKQLLCKSITAFNNFKFSNYNQDVPVTQLVGKNNEPCRETTDFCCTNGHEGK